MLSQENKAKIGRYEHGNAVFFFKKLGFRVAESTVRGHKRDTISN